MLCLERAAGIQVGQATEAARRAVQLFALLLAILAGPLSLSQLDDRAPRSTILHASLGPDLGRSEAPADLRLDQAEDQRADGDEGWGDDPSDALASVLPLSASLSDRLIAPAAAQPFGGRPTGGYRARAPPRL